MFVVLSIQHAIRMRHIFIYGLSGSTTFFHINLTKGTILETQVIELKMWSLTFYEFFLLLRRTERNMIQNVHLFSWKHPLYLPGVNETCISQQIFEKYSNMKFH
jgi:hypothetical protein